MEVDIAVLKREKQEKDEELERVNKTLSAKEEELEKKEEELVDNAIYYAMKTTAKLMKEFKDGKVDTWEPDQAIEEFTQAYPEEGEVNEVNSKKAEGEQVNPVGQSNREHDQKTPAMD